MTATAIQPLTAAAFAEIAARQIALTPALGLWVASVDEFGDTITTERRKVRSISATASTPLGAVRELLGMLDAADAVEA